MDTFEEFCDNAFQGWTPDQNDILIIEEESNQNYEYEKNLEELITFAEELKKHNIDYIFVNDLADNFQLDHSNFRKFIVKHGINLNKKRHPTTLQISNCVSKEDAKEILKLKFGV